MHRTAVLDIDGTLVDTNYHHAIAWYRAFRRHGIVLPLWRIHRHIGMGGDQLVEALAGARVERELGDAIRDTEKEQYMGLIDEVEPLPGARDLLVELKQRGHALVMASSAKPDEVEHYLKLLDAKELADDWTTWADVQATKPAPDLVRVAIDKSGQDSAVLVGDSIWDAKAAGRIGVPTIGVLTGGFSEQELRDAGVMSVFESVEHLLERLDETPFA
jgi:HAD superfamily hydrolase (TIGR01509 family)